MSESKKISNIEPIFISDEMLDEVNIDSKLRDRLIKDADEIEKTLNANPKLDDIEVPAGMLDSLTAALKDQGYWEDEDSSAACVGQVQKRACQCMHAEAEEVEYGGTMKCGKISKKAVGAEGLSDVEIHQLLSPEDRDSLDLGKRIKKRKRWQGPLIKVACGIIIFSSAFGLSMTSEANRKYMIGVWNSIVSDGLSIHINTTESLKVTDQEEDAYSKIKNKLGINPVQLMYKPEGLMYNNYSLNNEDRCAQMFYLYNDTLTNIYMYNGDIEQANVRTFDGINVDTYEISLDLGKVGVNVICNPDTGEMTYIAQLVIDNIYYSISSAMEKSEFDKMIQYMII